MHYQVKNVGPTRLPSGRFSERDAMAGITPVRLGNGLIGYRVGPGGVIWDDLDVARRKAKQRAAYYGE